MNNVEIVIDYYLHITSHVSQVIACCTHYTSYSLLNLVDDIVCDFVVAIQDYMFLDFNAKCVLHCFSWTCNQGWPYYLYITCLCTLFNLDELILLHFANFSYVVHVEIGRAHV